MKPAFDSIIRDIMNTITSNSSRYCCKILNKHIITPLHSKKGVTLIELIVALAMAATLTISVYYFWNNINRHTTTYTDKALFSRDANRIITSIIKQLRSATEIISFDYNTIKFISKNGDTLAYRYDGDSLYLNESSISILSRNARISQFEIKDLNESVSSEARLAYLEFTFSMISGNNDTAAYTLSVNVPKPAESTKFW
jgi:prepilin-type N-terminal cleavage/methylation domain-containing protein